MNDGVVDAVAVAASWGGLEALKTILGALPKDLAAAVLVVQHRPSASGLRGSHAVEMAPAGQ